MERMSIKAYAVKHKLSLFNVMKMIKTGKVKSEVFQEKGREVTYILIDEEQEKEIMEKIVPFEEKKEVNLQMEVQNLKEALKQLTQEVEALKKKIF